MDDIKTVLKEQRGKTIIKSSAGGAVGTLWKIDLENGNCFFFHCSWRLLKDGAILITSQDPIEVNGIISKTTPSIEEEKIEDIQFTNEYDISIMISNHFRIDLFCDVGINSAEYNSLTNWDICIPSIDKVISISNEFKIVEEKYS